VTREHVSHAGKPFRREATSGHSFLRILVIALVLMTTV